MPGRGVACDHPPCLQVEDANVIPAVEGNEFVCTKTEFSKGRLSCRLEGDADPLLTEYIDDASAKLAFLGADCEEGLDRVICEGGYLGVDPIASKLLLSALNMRRHLAGHTSSTMNRSDATPFERSPCTPACLPRRKCAMIRIRARRRRRPSHPLHGSKYYQDGQSTMVS